MLCNRSTLEADASLAAGGREGVLRPRVADSTDSPTLTIEVDESGHPESAACIPLHFMPQLSLMTPNTIHYKPMEELASRD